MRHEEPKVGRVGGRGRGVGWGKGRGEGGGV